MPALTRYQARRARSAAGTLASYAYRNRYTLARSAGRAVRRAYHNVRRVYRNNRFPTRRDSVGGAAFSGNEMRSSYRPPPTLRSTKKIAKAKRRSMKKSKTQVTKNRLSTILYKNLCTPQTLKWTYANSFAGRQGQRSYVSVFLGGESFIQYLATKKPVNFLFDASPSAGTGTSTSLQDQGQKNWKLNIEKLMFDMRIQNRCNASMELKIYECVVRHDFPATIGYQYIEAMLGRSMGTVPTAIGTTGNIGPAQDALTQNVTAYWQLPSSTPFDSNEFTSTFKIVRQASVKMGPNEIMPLKTYLRSRTFNGSWIYSDASKECQKGWTKILLFSWVGQPVDDGTMDNNSKSRNDLVVQYDGYCKFHFLPGQSKLVNYVLNTKGSTAGGTAQYGPLFYGYTNVDGPAGTANQYIANPAGMTPVIPASEVVQTVSGSATVGSEVPQDDL